MAPPKDTQNGRVGRNIPPNRSIGQDRGGRGSPLQPGRRSGAGRTVHSAQRPGLDPPSYRAPEVRGAALSSAGPSGLKKPDERDR